MGVERNIRRKETWLRVPDPFYLPRVCLWLYVAASIDPDPWPQPGTDRPHNLSFHPPASTDAHSYIHTCLYVSYIYIYTPTYICNIQDIDNRDRYQFSCEPCLEFQTEFNREAKWFIAQKQTSLENTSNSLESNTGNFSLMSRVVEISINQSVIRI